VFVCVCCVWDSLEQVWESDGTAGGFVLCVCECVCCVWGSLEQVCGSEYAAGGFVLCECVIVAFGTVWSRFGGVSFQQVALGCVCVCLFDACVCVCWEWDSLEQVRGSEGATGGFVV